MAVGRESPLEAAAGPDQGDQLVAALAEAAGQVAQMHLASIVGHLRAEHGDPHITRSFTAGLDPLQAEFDSHCIIF